MKNTAAVIDEKTPRTYTEITEKQVCPLCHKEVTYVHTWVRLNGVITHDYCVRVAGLR